jgi:hypothetical protein
MTPPRWAALPGLVVLSVLLTGCACGGRQAEAPAPEASPAPEGALPQLEHIDVVLFFPAEDGSALLPEKRTIVKTSEPGTLAKQVIAELVVGPQEAGKVRALPEGTVLRQVYLTPGGTAYADFGPELRAGLGGGSAAELMAVYAVVNALSSNIPGVRKVGILIGGQPVDSLNGHLDLSRPLPPRQDLVRGTLPTPPPAAPEG